MVHKLQTRTSYFTYSNWKLVGFLDSDASFQFKLTKRQGNKLGYGLVTAFSQAERNKEILEHLQKQLGVKAKIRTNITGQLANGEDKKECILDVAWTPAGGKALLKILKKCSPRCTSKLRDYLIGLIFLDGLKNKYILEKVRFKNWSDAKKEKVSAVASVLLCFQMSNQANPNSKTRKKESSPQKWFDYLKPSSSELAEGTKLFESYFAEILSKLEAHEQYLTSGKARLPLEYLRGFFIGDGCLSVSYGVRKVPLKKGRKVRMTKRNRFKLYRRFWFIERINQTPYKCIARFCNRPLSIRYEPYFSLTGDFSSQSLFQAVFSTFGVGDIDSSLSGNSCYFRLRGWEKAKNIVFPFLDNKDLPTFRMEQFQKLKLLLPYSKDMAYTNRKNVKKILKILYKMNLKGTLRRKTERKILHSFRIYFKSRKRLK